MTSRPDFVVRRAGDRRAIPRDQHTVTKIPVLPSAFVGRVNLAILVAPWIVLLALKQVFQLPAVTSSSFFFVLFAELAAVTLAGLTMANARLQHLKTYEADRESERLLFSHSSDGMVLLRVRQSKNALRRYDFVVEAQNPVAMRRLGAPDMDSQLGKEMGEVFPQWLRSTAYQEFVSCIETEQVRRYEVCTPNGVLAHESIATPVWDAATSRVSHVVVVIRDIAARLLHQRDLDLALEKAEAANKSKSEFLASMSHELRTPLNAIIGFSDLLVSGMCGTLSEKQREYVSDIHRSGGHLLAIITDILDLSKIEAGQFSLHEQPFAIDELFDGCLLMVRERAIAKALPIRSEIAAGIPSLVADPLRLKQLLINLLSNAVKFTDKGEVRLSASYDPKAGFQFCVADTGIGMSPEGVRTAMEPFGQVEGAFSRHHEGTGLGLPIASRLASLHGGKLEVESCAGLGTRITVTLPAGRAMFQQSERLLA
jgi:signal transduction histidine kinase